MDNDERIVALQKLVDRGSRWADTASKGVELIKSASELTGQTSEVGRNVSLIVRHWTEAPTDRTPFALRKVQKEEFISNALAKTGDHVRANQGHLPKVNSLLTNIFSGGIDPFSGLVVNSVIGLIDGHLTRKTLSQGFAQVSGSINAGLAQTNRTLEQGFESVITAVDRGFKDLSTTFTWGTAELMWRMDQQTTLAKSIGEALTRPLETQVKELRERAIKSYNYGWYDEALSDLLDAMAKARVDYVVAQYLANIYLFYKRDYAKAIEYYRKAARYSEPESGHHAAVALMHEGLAHYFATGDDPDGTNQFAAAAECLKRAQVLMPGWLELKYQFAQYSVLANNRQEGLKAIRSLLDLQPLYILKIAAEEDFLSVREEIAKIVDEMHHNFTSNLAHELNSHKIFITTLRGHYGENFDRDEVKTYLSVLELIGALLASGDFVSIVRALEMEGKLHYPTANPRKLSPRHAYGPYGYKQASSYGSSSPARQPYETSWPIGGELI